MTKESILLVGVGGYARVCVDVIEQEGRLKNLSNSDYLLWIK